MYNIDVEATVNDFIYFLGVIKFIILLSIIYIIYYIIIYIINKYKGGKTKL